MERERSQENIRKEITKKIKKNGKMKTIEGLIQIHKERFWLVFLSCIDKERTLSEICEMWGYKGSSALFQKGMTIKMVECGVIEELKFKGVKRPYKAKFSWLDEYFHLKCPIIQRFFEFAWFRSLFDIDTLKLMFSGKDVVEIRELVKKYGKDLIFNIIKFYFNWFGRDFSPDIIKRRGIWDTDIDEMFSYFLFSKGFRDSLTDDEFSNFAVFIVNQGIKNFKEIRSETEDFDWYYIAEEGREWKLFNQFKDKLDKKALKKLIIPKTKRKFDNRVVLKSVADVIRGAKS